MIVGFSVLLACANAANTSNTSAAAQTPVPAGTSAPVPTPPVVEAARISRADAKKAFDDGSAVFVDVRAADSYNREHITGALNIPLADLNSKADTLPKGKKIIVYCS
jgi:hypothetical protein